MRIGLLSDSHGDTRRLRIALELMAGRNVTSVVHCGDVGSLDGMELLANSGMASWLVAGNMDRHLRHKLHALALELPLTYWYSTVEVPLGDDAYLVATHGDNESLLEELIEGGQFPYVCHGHTHHARDIRRGDTRVICPGALYAPRHPPFATLAILDTDTDTVEFYDINRPDTPVNIQDGRGGDQGSVVSDQ